MGISVCMIVRNEQTFLPSALESVKGLADEIIIVDTGSTDRTKDIARSHTSKVYSHRWHNHFSDARNFSISKATQDWILVLDADEVIAKEDHETIRALTNEKMYVGFSFHQISYLNDPTFYGYQPLLKKTSYSKDFSGYLSCEVVRLFKRDPRIKFEGAVHETVLPSARAVGDVKRTSLLIHHYQFAKGYEIQKQKQLEYLTIYEQHLDQAPDKAKAYRDIGSIAYEFLHDYQKAADAFTKSLDIDQHHLKTYVGLGLSYLQIHQVRKALHIIKQGLSHFPHDPQLLSLSAAAKKVKNPSAYMRFGSTSS